MFQLLGLGILAVGVWAWTEKDTFNNLSRLTNIALDPAFILILIGEFLLQQFSMSCTTCLMAVYGV
jgi:tetraspanin-5